MGSDPKGGILSRPCPLATLLDAFRPLSTLIDSYRLLSTLSTQSTIRSQDRHVIDSHDLFVYSLSRSPSVSASRPFRLNLSSYKPFPRIPCLLVVPLVLLSVLSSHLRSPVSLVTYRRSHRSRHYTAPFSSESNPIPTQPNDEDLPGLRAPLFYYCAISLRSFRDCSALLISLTHSHCLLSFVLFSFCINTYSTCI